MSYTGKNSVKIIKTLHKFKKNISDYIKQYIMTQEDNKKHVDVTHNPHISQYKSKIQSSQKCLPCSFIGN